MTSTKDQTELIPKDVYHEVYRESIRNAEMLIEEAKLIAQTKSKTHARMLHNLAIEEVAKGYTCLLTACGMIPRNHPLVLRRGKQSVFAGHEAKYSAFNVLAQDTLLNELKKAGFDVGESSGDQRFQVRGILAALMGLQATKKRFEWMYVDVVKETAGSWSVSSPLKLDPNDAGVDFNLTELVIARVKSLDNICKTTQFDAVRQAIRERAPQVDPSYPKNPVW